jgi:hypothetical protein
MPELFEDRMKYFEAGEKEQVSTEPHHQRIWNLYREYVFKNVLTNLQSEGHISADDLERAKPYFDNNGLPSPSLY